MSLTRLALLFVIAAVAINFSKQKSRTTELARADAALAATPGATDALGLTDAPARG